MNSLKSFFGIFLILISTGCATIEVDWEKAARSDTLQSYQAFMNKHPESKFAAEARSRIQNLDWAKAESTNTIKAYQDFMSNYPKSNLSVEAKDRIEAIIRKDWEAAQNVNTLKAYQEFITRYQNSNFNVEAYSRIQKIAETLSIAPRDITITIQDYVTAALLLMRLFEPYNGPLMKTTLEDLYTRNVMDDSTLLTMPQHLKIHYIDPIREVSFDDSGSDLGVFSRFGSRKNFSVQFRSGRIIMDREKYVITFETGLMAAYNAGSFIWNGKAWSVVTDSR